MHPRLPIPGAAMACAIVAVALTVGPAWSQPGSLISTTKINSYTFAALGAPLHDSDEFGDAVAALGDLDGPGPSVSALAVGAINDDDGGQHFGAVYICFLNAAGGVLSYRKISATQGNFTGTLESFDEFGSSIASLGDLDGPGPSVMAIAVGTINDDDGGPDRGAVYILFLNSTGLVIATQKISDLQGNLVGALHDNDEFGGAVASLGDLDGPGPSPVALAVGAVYDDQGGPDRGCVHVLFLNSNGTVASHTKIGAAQVPMVQDFDNFGEDVSWMHDLDGPGPSAGALAVGSCADNEGGPDRGAVYILFLNTAGGVLSYQKIADIQGNFTAPLANEDAFGTAVAALGDIDGAGPSAGALAVGAGGDDGAGLDRGATYILFLTAAGRVLSYTEYSSTAGGFASYLDDVDEFGSGLAALGDLNGAANGVQTLAVGVGFDDDAGLDRGAVYLMNLAGSLVVGVDDLPEGPAVHGLGRARPNLFTHSTTIPFRVQADARVRIDVCDASGRLVRRLVDARMGAGEHQAVWDGADDAGRPLSPAVYFLSMAVGGRTVTKGSKLLLLR